MTKDAAAALKFRNQSRFAGFSRADHFIAQV